MDSAEKCIFAEWKVIFTGDEHKFTVHEHMFTGDEHKFTAYKYKIVKCVANFVIGISNCQFPKSGNWHLIY